jgi:hypothetical protein
MLWPPFKHWRYNIEICNVTCAQFFVLNLRQLFLQFLAQIFENYDIDPRITISIRFKVPLPRCPRESQPCTGQFLVSMGLSPSMWWRTGPDFMKSVSTEIYAYPDWVKFTFVIITSCVCTALKYLKIKIYCPKYYYKVINGGRVVLSEKFPNCTSETIKARPF